MTFLSGFDPPEEGENLVLFWGNFPMLINMISQESYIHTFYNQQMHVDLHINAS